MATVFLVVYTFMYRNQRINSVVGTGNYIMSTYPENATEENKARFVQVLDEIVVVNNISVVIFSKTNTDEELTLDNISVIVSRIREGEGNMADITNQAINDKYMSNIDNKTNFHFIVNNPKYKGTDLVVGGQKQSNGETVYFYIHAFVKEEDFATSFFYQLFMGMSIVALGVSILYAFFIGKRITSPLVKLSQEVRKAGKNENYEIQVDGNGYVELDDLAHSLDASLKEQQKTEHFRRDLVANVSHDLRTPLTMIKAYAEMIRDLSGNNPP
jgi:signal transduction histidine kinase